MKKHFVGLLFLSCKVFTSQPALTGAENSQSQGKILFPVNRTTNLVICNDVMESTSRFNLPWEEEKWLKEDGAITTDLLYTLVDNQCPVLCTKSVLLTIQMLNQLWQNYLDQSVDTIFIQFKKSLPTSRLRQFLKMSSKERGKVFYKPISLYKDKITKLTHLYNEINKQKTLNENLKVSSLVKELKDVLLKKESFNGTTVSLKNLFSIYSFFKIICAHDYVCKEVNSDFVVFIPKSLIHQSKNTDIQDLKLGLSYSVLPDYDYKKLPSSEIRKDIIKDTYEMEKTDSLGASLYEALQLLIITKYNVTEKTKAWNINIDKVRALLPFFNIFLNGHGDLDKIIAEISIKKEKDQQFSDFEKIVLFFNNSINTKFLTILSCYSGGKKILKTFNVKNAFDFSILDSITYPIINIGTLMTPTTLDAFSHDDFLDNTHNVFFSNPQLYGLWKYGLNSFSHYFNLLNEVPSNYEKAFKFIAGFYPEDESFKLENYINVKLPNVSWYSPHQFKKHTATISQIEALAKPKIIFTDSLEEEEFLQFVLLGANVVPGEIVFKNFKSDFPMFLPVNYHNQNYVIQKISVPDLKEKRKESFSVHQYLRNFLPIPNVKEPINFVIKELNLGNQTYKNIYSFTQHKISGLAKKSSGFIFTDLKGETKMISWPSYKESREVEVKAGWNSFDTQEALNLIEQVEVQARKALQQFPGLEDDSFKKLEQVMKNKAKGLIPKEIQKSYDTQAKNEMFSRVFDVVHQIAQQKQLLLGQEKQKAENQLSHLIDMVHFLNVDFV